jgi:hypothetical protein
VSHDHPLWSFGDSQVQDFVRTMDDGVKQYGPVGYDPTGGLGWERFLDQYLKGFDERGRPEWVWPKDPPNTNGFTDGVSRPVDLASGDTIERITFLNEKGQAIDGSFAAPSGTPFDRLSIPPDRLGGNAVTVRYEVLKPLPDGVRMGDVAPGFEQPGHGTQYYFPDKIKKLIKDGYLRVIE